MSVSHELLSHTASDKDCGDKMRLSEPYHISDPRGGLPLWVCSQVEAGSSGILQMPLKKQKIIPS